MLTLVMGPNNSGKSDYAERLAMQTGAPRLYYIATMQRSGEAAAARIAKHRAQREGRGFITVELPYGIQAVDAEADSCVLIEDASNLLANLMFEAKDSNAVHTALGEIKAVAAKCKGVIVVNLNRLKDDIGYDGETRGYIAGIDALNRELSDIAETVVQVLDGVPTILKGKDAAYD